MIRIQNYSDYCMWEGAVPPPYLSNLIVLKPDFYNFYMHPISVMYRTLQKISMPKVRCYQLVQLKNWARKTWHINKVWLIDWLTHPKEGHWKFWGGWRSQKTTFVKESMNLNWNSQKGSNQKNMDIFWNNTETNYSNNYWTEWIHVFIRCVKLQAWLLPELTCTTQGPINRINTTFQE